jgi:hypothetical protein
MSTTPTPSKPRASITVRRGAKLFLQYLTRQGLIIHPGPLPPATQLLLYPSSSYPVIPPPPGMTSQQRGDWTSYVTYLGEMAIYLATLDQVTETTED